MERLASARRTALLALVPLALVALAALSAPAALGTSPSSPPPSPLPPPVDCADAAEEIAALHGIDPRHLERTVEGARPDLATRPDLLRAAIAEAYFGELFPHRLPAPLGALRRAVYRLPLGARLLEHDLRSLPPRERPIYRALVRGAARLEVLRVEDWTPSRCRPESPRPFEYLVRIAVGSRVRSQLVLHPDGRFGRYGHPRPGAVVPAALDTLPTRLAELGVRLPVEHPRHVRIHGLHSRCGTTNPCIAFQSGPDTYLLTADGTLLFRIDPDDRKSVTRQREERLALGAAAPLCTGDPESSPYVTVGYELRRAELVADGRG